MDMVMTNRFRISRHRPSAVPTQCNPCPQMRPYHLQPQLRHLPYLCSHLLHQPLHHWSQQWGSQAGQKLGSLNSCPVVRFNLYSLSSHPNGECIKRRVEHRFCYTSRVDNGFVCVNCYLTLLFYDIWYTIFDLLKQTLPNYTYPHVTLFWNKTLYLEWSLETDILKQEYFTM